MDRLRFHSPIAYAEHLTAHADEADALLSHVLVSVSRFFRDAPVYERMRAHVLPELVARVGPQGAVRMWSAGCGRGQEPYSLGILAEVMASQAPALPAILIWGTDASAAALVAAERGVYRRDDMVDTPLALAQRYFATGADRRGETFLLSSAIRGRVRLVRHDLLSGRVPVWARQIHLVLCRNVLIYIGLQEQAQVLRLLTSALAPGGYLCLGEAEQLPAQLLDDMTVVDRPARLYRKAEAAGPSRE
jgi:chemotaxis methyl-accepting protein methylase